MEFVGQRIDFSDYALEFFDDVAVLFFHFTVAILVVGMCMSQSFNLLLSDIELNRNHHNVFMKHCTSTHMFLRPMNNKIKLALLLRLRKRLPQPFRLFWRPRNMDLSPIWMKDVAQTTTCVVQMRMMMVVVALCTTSRRSGGTTADERLRCRHFILH
jgi:hypothetical protein